MSIFNSLGSNYNWSFVKRSLFARGSKDSLNELSTTLSQHYGGKVTLTYKGRQALEIALKNSGLQAGSNIGINGFTCYVVYKAVKNAGYQPVFVDIAPQQLNFGIDELKQASTKYGNIKAVIIQNTLGYPADMTSLAEYCKLQDIMIIEDLAHSTGLVYADGQEAGRIGYFTMMSFSQDKPVDVVAGGALIDRRKNKASDINLPKASLWQRSRNRLYPLWTGLIRTTYPVGIGRFIHFGLKKLHLMSTPMSDDIQGLYCMQSSAAKLILERWQERTIELQHRRTIADIYDKNLAADFRIPPGKNGEPAYLRYPILTNNRDSLINYLRTQQIYIGDTWYDVPVGPKKYLALTDYELGACPTSEKLAARIVNLPTHINVTTDIAKDICVKIKQWQTLQQKA